MDQVYIVTVGVSIFGVFSTYTSAHIHAQFVMEDDEYLPSHWTNNGAIYHAWVHADGHECDTVRIRSRTILDY